MDRNRGDKQTRIRDIISTLLATLIINKPQVVCSFKGHGRLIPRGQPLAVKGKRKFAVGDKNCGRILTVSR